MRNGHIFLDEVVPIRPVLPTDPDNRHRNIACRLNYSSPFFLVACKRSFQTQFGSGYAQGHHEWCVGKNQIMSFDFLRILCRPTHAEFDH